MEHTAVQGSCRLGWPSCVENKGVPSAGSKGWGLLAWKHPLVFVKQAPSVDVVDRGSYLGECEAVPIPLQIHSAECSDVFLHSAVLYMLTCQAEVIPGMCCCSVIAQSEYIVISWLCPLFAGDTWQE